MRRKGAASAALSFRLRGLAFDGCYLCGAAVATVIGAPGITAPVCEQHERSIRCEIRSAATIKAQHEVAAREWRARQTVLFDDHHYKVFGRKKGWWE